jgi:hypothetical protein
VDSLCCGHDTEPGCGGGRLISADACSKRAGGKQQVITDFESFTARALEHAGKSERKRPWVMVVALKYHIASQNVSIEAAAGDGA